MRSTANAVFTVALCLERGLHWCPETLSCVPTLRKLLLRSHDYGTDLHNEHNP